MTGRLKSNRKGWNDLKRKLKTFDYERSVDVGFFANAQYGPDNDNLQVAQVAAWNDYGTSTNPPRPFMTIDFAGAVKSEFKDYARRVFVTLLTRNITQVNQEIEHIGIIFEEELKDIIVQYPGSNASWWAAEKGFNDPLRHTDTMLESVSSRVKKGSRVIKKG
jgi:hypothetical protein